VGIIARKDLSKMWNIPFNLAKMVGYNKGHDMWGWVQTHYKKEPTTPKIESLKAKYLI
jgi:hypothetical protein